MTDAFNRWWNAEELVEGNPYNKDTPAYWAWVGWQAGMTDKEYEQAMADEGQRRMLEIDTEVRAMIKEAVDAEREACAKVCDERKLPRLPDSSEFDHLYNQAVSHCAKAIRARGQG
jgi:hypothetical protein